MTDFFVPEVAEGVLSSGLSELSLVETEGPATTIKLPDTEIITVDAKAIQIKLLNELGGVSGIDSDGNSYTSIEELWRLEFFKRVTEQHNEWYDKGYQYWESATNCPISDNGVLGGFGHLTPVDTIGSNMFLDEVLRLRPGLRFHKAAGTFVRRAQVS